MNEPNLSYGLDEEASRSDWAGDITRGCPLFWNPAARRERRSFA